jgi:hypothetical protein
MRKPLFNLSQIGLFAPVDAANLVQRLLIRKMRYRTIARDDFPYQGGP